MSRQMKTSVLNFVISKLKKLTQYSQPQEVSKENSVKEEQGPAVDQLWHEASSAEALGDYDKAIEIWQKTLDLKRLTISSGGDLAEMDTIYERLLKAKNQARVNKIKF